MRLGALAVLLGALLAQTGCATARRQQAVVKQMHDFVYPRPLHEIWPQVEAFISAQGYPVQKGEEQYLLVSSWVTSFHESRVASSVERILVEGRPLNRANSEVRIYRESVMTGNKARPSHRELNNASHFMVLAEGDENPMDQDFVYHSHQIGEQNDPQLKQQRNRNRLVIRDLELEWRLLLHLDPEEARQAEARAAAGR